MINSTLPTIEEIRDSIKKRKDNFEQANVQRSFLSFSDSNGKGIVMYENGSFILFHTKDLQIQELGDLHAYVLLKKISDGELKINNIIMVLKNNKVRKEVR